MSKPTVLVCRCANTDFVPPADVDGLVSRLHQSGCAVTAVDDLCGLVARRDPMVGHLVEKTDHLTIAACFPRAIRGLFLAAGAPLPDGANIFNLRTQSIQEVFEAISGCTCEEVNVPRGDGPVADVSGGSNSKSEIQNLKSEISSSWLPWFPVIDYSRCRHCRQCANFCLFGVYAIDEGKKVRVARPASCKPLCPACARLCPHAAIIFPKYGSAPINGDEVTPENIGREHVGEELLKSPAATGSLLETLRQRATGFRQPPPDVAPTDPVQSEIRNGGSSKSEIALPSDAQRILDSARRRAAQSADPDSPAAQGDA